MRAASCGRPVAGGELWATDERPVIVLCGSFMRVLIHADDSKLMDNLEKFGCDIVMKFSLRNISVFTKHFANLTSFIGLVVLSTVTVADDALPSLFDGLIDDDGWLDSSDFLLERKGSFLPLPIIITEPALDSGLGVAGLFFHERPESEVRESDKFIRPSISGLAAGVTGNDSWFVGGGHMGIWKKDTLRYTGGGGYGSVNLKFYVPNTSRGLAFNSEGAVVTQSLKMRLGDSQWWLGGDWQYSKLNIEFDLGNTIVPLDPIELDFANSGLSGNIEYDSRDNSMTPNSGIRFRAGSTAFRESIGGDFDYEKYHIDYNQFFSFGSKFMIGVRLDGDFIDGTAPFFAKPFVTLRGIPTMRYQADNVFVAETEVRWEFHPRMSLVAFTGFGRASNDVSELNASPSRINQGVGFRYFLAKDLGMRLGFDIAKGP